MSSQRQLTALPSVDSGKVASVPSIISEIPDKPARLTAREKKIWDHICQALLEYGLIHRTDGLTITIICKTFCDWIDADRELEKYKRGNGGSYITESGNGYRSPHPLYYVVRDHKNSLLKWLPEAALTIPSFVKIKGEDFVASQQGNLFEDPVEKFRQRKTRAGMRLVEGDEHQ
jgi:phage terminase small subunit